MPNSPTVKEMQAAILTIRRFADENDYTLCRPYLKSLVMSCAEVLDTVLYARDWEPVRDD